MNLRVTNAKALLPRKYAAILFPHTKILNLLRWVIMVNVSNIINKSRSVDDIEYDEKCNRQKKCFDISGQA